MPHANAKPGSRLTDHAMTAALVLSVAVHTAAFALLATPKEHRTPMTDVVGDSTELLLGFDTTPTPATPTIPEPELKPEPAPVKPPPAEPPAKVEVAIAPPETKPEPKPEPKPELPPETAPEPAKPEPAPAPDPFQLAEQPAPTPQTTPNPTPAAQPAPTPSFAVDVPRTTPSPEAAATTPSAPPVAQRPVAAFAGIKAERARKVVYAVDISGVMVDSLPFVFEELDRCVARLGSDQEFQVVLFRDPIKTSDSESDPAVPELAALRDRATWLNQTSADPALTPVTEQARADLRKLLASSHSDGVSNPLTGLRLALAMKPDVIFLLTRGIRRSATTWGPSESRLMAALDDANPKNASGQRATTIRTVQFVSADPTGLLDRIAKEHGGGSCTVLTVAELNKAAKAKPAKR